MKAIQQQQGGDDPGVSKQCHTVKQCHDMCVCTAPLCAKSLPLPIPAAHVQDRSWVIYQRALMYRTAWILLLISLMV